MVNVSLEGSSISTQSNLCRRLHTSWHAQFSPRMRYEIASVIAIIGLILMLGTFASVYAMYSTGGLAEAFYRVCARSSVSPVALVTLVLVVGAVCLLFGIWLLPNSSGAKKLWD